MMMDGVGRRCAPGRLKGREGLRLPGARLWPPEGTLASESQVPPVAPTLLVISRMTGTVTGDQGQAIATCCENLASSSHFLISGRGREWNGAFAHRTMRRSQRAARLCAGSRT